MSEVPNSVVLESTSHEAFKQVGYDTYNVKYTDRIELPNGYDVQIVELEYFNKDDEIQNIHEANVDDTEPKISILQRGSRPIKSCTIFLMKESEYVGQVSANLMEDQTANLSMFPLHFIELPSDAGSLRENLNSAHKDGVALKVVEEYRGRGISKVLMTLLLNYLSIQGIREVKVNGISGDIAMETYLKTGAEKTGENTAIYKNLKELLEKNKDNEILSDIFKTLGSS